MFVEISGVNDHQRSVWYEQFEYHKYSSTSGIITDQNQILSTDYKAIFEECVRCDFYGNSIGKRFISNASYNTDQLVRLIDLINAIGTIRIWMHWFDK